MLKQKMLMMTLMEMMKYCTLKRTFYVSNPLMLTLSNIFSSFIYVLLTLMTYDIIVTSYSSYSLNPLSHSYSCLSSNSSFPYDALIFHPHTRYAISSLHSDMIASLPVYYYSSLHSTHR